MSRKAKNILFIMFDQLRFDYLSCYGHPHLHTPNIDKLADKGVRFTNCYAQSPICGSSRMSFYTGRYPSSHGALWNAYPLRAGEITIGDHLRTLGMDSYLIGKTHMRADVEGMNRLGIPADSIIGARVAECGFDVFDRDDGLWAEGPDGFYDQQKSSYNEYLIAKGYDSDNPWHDYANSGIDDNGEIASGWMMMHANKPANIREEDSETPYMTGRCINFIDQMSTQDTPWMCHLSYIKPHWPYIVPEPYHSLYGKDDIIPVNRHDNEKIDTHPIYAQFMNNAVGKAFQRDEVLDTVIPAYMGLIKQADDQLGRLFTHLEETGRFDDTMIVITSDHGDYMGDHWLGEKDLFHEPSVRIPMIIYDPSTKADASRGKVCDELVESIDLAATFYETAGGVIEGTVDHILEGQSLLPLLHQQACMPVRDYAFSEYDYSVTPAAVNLGINPRQAQLYMVTDKRWKYIFAEGDIRPMLFDLQTDPQELNDLGASETPQHIEVKTRLFMALSQWWRRVNQRTTRSDNELREMRGKSRRRGIVLGMYDSAEADAELTSKFRGQARQRYTPSN
ncbi:MAG: sulfatase-like hydrolase/transferase [Leucothrix sp.]